jgi:arsenate reductase
MAEGLLRELAGHRYDVHSAGLEATEVHPLAIAAMHDRGIDISGQRSKSLDEYVGRRHFAILVTVCDEAESRCPTLPGVSTREHWSFDDPAAAIGDDEDRLDKFREVRDALEARMKDWLRRRSELPVSLVY